MDFLLTRLAMVLKRLGVEAVVIHDKTGKSREIADMLDEMK